MSVNRLLVVDDDEDMGEAVSELGRRAGYETVHITDPVEAKRRVAEWAPSVIVTDLQMPNIDGVALLRLLASEGANAQIVIVSGMDRKLLEMAGNLAKQRGLKIAGTFTKPFANAELSACLEQLKQHGPVIATDIAQALRRDEITVFFQAKCDLATGRPLGAEALARWHSPARGLVQPDDFLPLISAAGLSDVLFDKVLSDAVAAAAGYRKLGLVDDSFHIAVNMTAENLVNLSMPDRVRAICEQHGWPEQRLTLELTETSSMDESFDVMDVLARLRIMNFNLSVDDFGTGFSSLLRLRQLPFTEIKIDKSFTSQILTSRDSAVIVKTILSMADSLGLYPIAEGVENQAIASELRSMGCKTGQGYHFSKPLNVGDFASWLATATASQPLKLAL